MLLVVTATGRESGPLREALGTAARVHDVHGVQVVDGSIGDVPVRLAATGIARSNTAFHLSRLLLDPPSAVLQVGVGGTFDEDLLPVTGVAVATSDTYADLGSLTETGWIGLDDVGFALVDDDGTGEPAGTGMPCDPALAEAAADHLGVVSGPFVTVETITGTRRMADAIAGRTAALVESMEGAAAAHACLIASVPFVQLRAASNVVGPRDRDAWRLADAITSACAAAIDALPIIHAATPGVTP